MKKENGAKRPITSRAAFFAVYAIQATVLGAAMLGKILRRARGERSAPKAYGEMELLVTGTFYNEGWLRSHLIPLSKTKAIKKIFVVTDQPMVAAEKVNYIVPPGWLKTIVGRSLARLAMIIHVALKKKPDLLMGYHIMPNALFCLLAASLTGSRSIYQMTGGPGQIIGGGAGSENILLKSLNRNYRILENLTFRVIRHFDLVVVRGTKSLAFADQHRLGKERMILTAGVDTEVFKPDGRPAQNDFICVSRLLTLKGIDYLMKVVKELTARNPSIKLALVGDGPKRGLFELQAKNLGIQKNIEFLGKMENVASALRSSRIFILTSPSEGMSIAMLEAMSAGLAIAVTDVGELADAVVDGENGIFLKGNDATADAEKILDLLSKEKKIKKMALHARKTAVENFSRDVVTSKWDHCLRNGIGVKN